MGLIDKVKGVGAVNTDTLTQQELTLLLKVIHEGNFEGKDVLLLADVVVKLQNQLKAK
tara:strand:- start:53415 stop:53588 length:174 start_codon:yes stop_codon:yes gene_type:complete